MRFLDRKLNASRTNVGDDCHSVGAVEKVAFPSRDILSVNRDSNPRLNAPEYHQVRLARVIYARLFLLSPFSFARSAKRLSTPSRLAATVADEAAAGHYFSGLIAERFFFFRTSLLPTRFTRERETSAARRWTVGISAIKPDRHSPALHFSSRSYANKRINWKFYRSEGGVR